MIATIIQISLCFAVLFGIVKCNGSDWWREHEQQNMARERDEETPHVIREADGCKVYAFKSGSYWHYFTRCGETVTTDRTYSQPCGKGCARIDTETVITHGNKK